MNTCPCGTGRSYEECCGPIIAGTKDASTAEQLMRSRYTAYVKGEIGYIYSSLHPEHREDFDEKSTRQWAKSSQWHKLEIRDTRGGGEEDTEGTVEFIAAFTDSDGRKEHHELSTFKKEDGRWYFVDGAPVTPGTVVREGAKVGRNAPCMCGSGKKYKKCCGKAG